MRAVGQELVIDTNASNPGLAAADWLILLNDAMHSYAEMFPDNIALSGVLVSHSIALNDKSVPMSFVPGTPIMRSITGVFLRGVGAMQSSPVLDILRKQALQPTVGTPTEYGFISSAPGTAATALAYTMYIWPIADASYTADVYGTVQPPSLTGDSDTSVFQDTDCRVIARMAAVEACRLLGRTPAFTQTVASPLPDRVRAHMGVAAREVVPRAYAGKPVV